jgi:membrane peptidoglycan carboxypeptidase
MKRRLLVWQSADPYDWSVLQFHPDLRTLMALRYMGKVAEAHGVREPLPPVMSIPLGAVDVNLIEAANLYQGIIDGTLARFEGVVDGADPIPLDPNTVLVQEIRDREGRVLYRSQLKADSEERPVQGRQVGDILRNVVRWGTGRRALNEIAVNGAVVPVSGKTGTTNSYRNASFAGFVPRLVDGRWNWGEGFTLVSYIGYDDNRSMRRGSVRLQGSNGALPVWMATAQSMALAGLLGEPNASTPPEWVDDPVYQRVPLDSVTGLPSDNLDEAQSLLSHGVWGPSRFFEPIGVDPKVAQELSKSMGRTEGSAPLNAWDNGSDSGTPEP